MTRFSYILSLIIFCHQSFGQIKIDDIKNDKDAVQFVFEYGKKNNMEWKKVGVDDVYGFFSKKNMDTKEKAFLDSLTKNKWIKSDFNEDGITDLIFFGKLYTQLGVLAFISKGDFVVCKYLGNALSSNYPSGINSFNKDGLNFLTVTSFVRNDLAEKILGIWKLDTLVYKFGGFVEFNKQEEKQIEFDSIIYRVSSPWMGFISVPQMKIYKDGSVWLYRNEYNYMSDSALWLNGIYQSTVNKETIESLRAILDYINFWDLNTRYSIRGVTDLGTGAMQIFYQGKAKSIEDYGSHGTYGLRLLYNKLDEIKFKCLPKKAE